ncbi:MAG TPA: tRNA pseudouridine(38-40) synthase TruA [Rhodospirillaceae bacterium]|nr:tRNA pseudouridine(38-40) synthase TruA [Rhodospirillaceae bacterium]
MPRYRLTVEYDGGGLVGWQRQDNGPSVQGLLEAAVLPFAGHAAGVVGAGRTDAGVHALGQVAHVDLDREFAVGAVRDGLNFWMRHVDDRCPVTVISAERVDDSFHARFSATGRRYRYRILNRRPPPTLEAGRAWWVARPLDAGAMQEAALVLVGHHDFSTFRAVNCQARSAFKTLDRLEVCRLGEEIEIFAAARSFLHHQVRNMVGSLKLVGEGRWSAGDIKRILAARDRRQGGPTAPPEGLYLTDVVY